jgi:hypothetical protein
MWGGRLWPRSYGEAVQMIHFAPMRRKGIGLLVTAFVCAAAVAGCGGSGGDDSMTAAETAEAYVDAQNAEDFARVCELLGDPLRQQLGGDRCVGFLREQTSGAPRHTYRLITLGEGADQATAYISTRGETGTPVKLSLFLEKHDGEWKVVGSGPTAPRGKPQPD